MFLAWIGAHQWTKIIQAQRKVRAAAQPWEELEVQPKAKGAAKAKAKAKGKAKSKAKAKAPAVKGNDAGADGIAGDDLSDEDREIKKEMAVESFQEGLENTKIENNSKRKRGSDVVKKTESNSNGASGSKPVNRNLDKELKNAADADLADGANLPAGSASKKRPIGDEQEPLAQRHNIKIQCLEKHIKFIYACIKY